MKSSRNIAVSIVVVIAIARVMFGSMARLSNVGCSKEPRRQTEPRCGNAANSGWQTGSFRYLGIPWRRTWRRRRTWSRTPVRLPCWLRDAELKNWSIADPRFPIRSCACVFETQFTSLRTAADTLWRARNRPSTSKFCVPHQNRPYRTWRRNAYP